MPIILESFYEDFPSRRRPAFVEPRVVETLDAPLGIDVRGPTSPCTPCRAYEVGALGARVAVVALVDDEGVGREGRARSSAPRRKSTSGVVAVGPGREPDVRAARRRPTAGAPHSHSNPRGSRGLALRDLLLRYFQGPIAQQVAGVVGEAEAGRRKLVRSVLEDRQLNVWGRGLPRGAIWDAVIVDREVRPRARPCRIEDRRLGGSLEDGGMLPARSGQGTAVTHPSTSYVMVDSDDGMPVVMMSHQLADARERRASMRGLVRRAAARRTHRCRDGGVHRTGRGRPRGASPGRGVYGTITTVVAIHALEAHEGLEHRHQRPGEEPHTCQLDVPATPRAMVSQILPRD